MYRVRLERIVFERLVRRMYVFWILPYFEHAAVYSVRLDTTAVSCFELSMVYGWWKADPILGQNVYG